ncbi:hypothetical protein Syun_016459 [Stephania yunnanensis]|uniref:Uncharacterized protein n=1 Tax=Stephania yunnanensis TaxID=152371 RepID=A0AAP0J4V6_9MAGN
MGSGSTPSLKKVSRVTARPGKGKAKKENIGKGVVKSAGKESTTLRDTSSKEKMEEVDGNEEDNPAGQLEDQHKQTYEELEVLLQKHFEVERTSRGTTNLETNELPMRTLQFQLDVREKMKVTENQLEELKMLVKSSNLVVV